MRIHEVVGYLALWAVLFAGQVPAGGPSERDIYEQGVRAFQSHDFAGAAQGLEARAAQKKIKTPSNPASQQGLLRKLPESSQ